MEQLRAVDDDPQALRYILDTLAGAGNQQVVTGDPKEAVHLMGGNGPIWTWCCPTPMA